MSEKHTTMEDRWFHDHFETASEEIIHLISSFAPMSACRVLDLGCGDGIIDLALALKTQVRQVVGLDINQSWKSLLQIATNNGLALSSLPSNLGFVLYSGSTFPFDAETFDILFSWSVLEHVADYEGILKECYRVLSPGGVFLIQIHPLFYSAFGSHLRRIIDMPFAHLIMTESELKRAVLHAKDNVPDTDKDVAYRTLDFQHFCEFLWNAYRELNRVTLNELQGALTRQGFVIQRVHLDISNNLRVGVKLQEYNLLDLACNGFSMIVQKPKATYAVTSQVLRS